VHSFDQHVLDFMMGFGGLVQANKHSFGKLNHSIGSSLILTQDWTNFHLNTPHCARFLSLAWFVNGDFVTVPSLRSNVQWTFVNVTPASMYCNSILERSTAPLVRGIQYVHRVMHKCIMASGGMDAPASCASFDTVLIYHADVHNTGIKFSNLQQIRIPIIPPVIILVITIIRYIISCTNTTNNNNNSDKDTSYAISKDNTHSDDDLNNDSSSNNSNNNENNNCAINKYMSCK